MRGTRTLVRPLRIIVLTAVAVTLIPMVVPQVAPSFSPKIAFAANCVQQPNDANCDGQDPVASGCNNNTVPIASARIYFNSNPTLGQIGVVYVEYSRTCKTKWAQTYNYSSPPDRVLADNAHLRRQGRGIGQVAPIRQYSRPWYMRRWA